MQAIIENESECMVGENQLLAGRRALNVVETLARSPTPLSFSKLEEVIGVSSATLSRLLKMLLGEGWVEMDPQGLYMVGARLNTMARHLTGHWSEHEIVDPVVKALAIDSGQSACFARFANDSFVLTAKAEMPSSFHFIDLFQKNHEMHNNGMALTLLAYVDPQTAHYLLEEQIGDSGMEQFETLFAKIRSDRVHVSKEGAITRVTVPIFVQNQTLVRSVISTASISLDDKAIPRVKSAVRDAAQEITQRFVQYNRFAEIA